MTTTNSSPNVFTCPNRERALAHDAVRRYRVNAEQRLIRARDKARQNAERRGHLLRAFTTDLRESAFLTATCEYCWAGVRIHVATGDASVSELLQLTCRGRGLR